MYDNRRTHLVECSKRASQRADTFCQLGQPLIHFLHGKAGYYIPLESKPVTMKNVLILMGVCLSMALQAQHNSSEEEAVKTAVNQLFEGMHKGDSARTHAVFAEGAILQSVIQTKKGLRFETETLGGFLNQIATLPLGSKIEERLLSMDVRIDQYIAQVWTPYAFYVNGTLSHCGTNAFQLAKIDDQWKIIHIVDTRRKNCD